MRNCFFCTAIEYRYYVETKIPVGNFGHSSFLHHDNCDELRQSADAGCRMCRVLLEAIAKSCLKKGQVDPDGTPIYPQGHSMEIGAPRSDDTRAIWLRQGPDFNIVGEVRTVTIPDDWADPWGNADAPLDTASVAAVDCWISQCEERHDDCRGTSAGTFMPTRLVHVDGQDPTMVRLLDAGIGTTPADAPYVALSHCWGLTMPDSAKTTLQNLDDHRRAIPLTDLSATFVDAIQFTRRLKIPFVWIDSLCIIQNSTQDWEREASQMAAIYSNARVTLAASGSSDGTQGCRLGELSREVSWPYVDSHLPGGLRFRTCSWAAGSSDVVDSDPLQRRGWTLQERELSPRMAHFSRDGLRCQ